jgi:hypothetical protein
MKDPAARQPTRRAREVLGKKIAHEYQAHVHDASTPNSTVLRDFRQMIKAYDREGQQHAFFGEIHVSGGWRNGVNTTAKQGTNSTSPSTRALSGWSGSWTRC